LLYQKIWELIRDARLKSWSEALSAIALISLASAGLLLVLKYLGKIESLELMAYDRMVQLRGSRPTDNRLLIVGITERDIEKLQVVPPDQLLARAIATLQSHNPRVIGLDLHRNAPQPPGWEELMIQMQAENVVVITKLGDLPADTIPPPPGIPPEQIGFNDIPVDPDGIIRRSLLIGSTNDGTFFSFALQSAIHYLEQENIQPRGSDQNPDFLQLGEAVFLPLQAGDGGYHQVDDGGYQILLDYRGEEAIAPQLSLSDILDNNFDPDLVKDRIVLIGTTATSLKDLFVTPYSSAQQSDAKMAGVEVHAHMISQILDAALGDRNLFWFWPEWMEVIWAWAWAIAGATVAWYFQRPIVLGMGSALLIGSISGVSYLCLLNHGWVPVIAPTTAFVLSSGIVITYRAQQAQQQQKMVMTLLGQSTSPEIADALWESRDRLLKSGKLPGQRIIATMMFSDIKGFSTLAEKLTPEDLMDWINEYLNEMVDVVKHHRGIVNKFTGDGLLAIFGVPVPRLSKEEIAKDARQAVQCALAMGDRLNQLNQAWEQKGVATARMRIGIFTGPIVAGSLGGKERLEYGVIGDSVNTAARLESCLKNRQPGICRILIARETLEYLDDQFRVEPWGEIELKGKEQLAEVYRVIQYVPNQSAEGLIASDNLNCCPDSTEITQKMVNP